MRAGENILSSVYVREKHMAKIFSNFTTKNRF